MVKCLRKSCWTIAAVITIIGVAAVLALRVWFYGALEPLPRDMYRPVRSVWSAYYLSKITGEYWENEMVAQRAIVAAAPLESRLAFYRSIILCCRLDTSRATLFAEIISVDAVALRQSLIRFRNSQRFEHLTTTQRRAVDDWIVEAEIIDGLTRSGGL